MRDILDAKFVFKWTTPLERASAAMLYEAARLWLPGRRLKPCSLPLLNRCRRRALTAPKPRRSLEGSNLFWEIKPVTTSALLALRRAPPRIIMEMIKRAPLFAPFLFRAYNFVLRRLGDRYEAPAYFGATFRCNVDDMISRTILYFGFWEPNNSALIGSILEPDDVFIDIGANIGYYTLLGSTLVGAKGRIVSIEASPAIFAQLEENAAMNRASNVRLINHAVSDTVEELPLYGGTRWNRGASSTTVHEFDQEPEARVPAAPLDTLLSKYEMERITLIKIDIEGGELPVLRRLLETLDKYPSEFMILAELAPQVSGEQLRAVFDGFLAAGFRTFAVENEYDTDWYLNWRRPSPLREIRALPSRQTDVLFVRGASRRLFDGWRARRIGWSTTDPAAGPAMNPH